MVEVVPFDKGETNNWREDSIIAKAVKASLDSNQGNYCRQRPSQPFCLGFKEAFSEIVLLPLESPENQ